jgi:autotransporter-associated beta strand protein
MKHQLRKNARITSFIRKALKPLFAVCALAPVFAFHTASAQNLFWDANAGAGGTGNWDLATQNWGTAVNTAPSSLWVQGDVAVFGSATTGTVTLTNNGGSIISASGLTFQVGTGTSPATTYVITDDGTATLQFTGAAVVTMNGATTAVISTALTTANPGVDTLTFTGAGTVYLTSNNTSYNGASVTVTGGVTLAAAGVSAFPNVAFIVGTGGTGGTLDVFGSAVASTQAIASLSGDSSGVVTNSQTTYTNLQIGALANASTSFAGSITDGATTIETTSNTAPASGLGITVVAPATGYTLQLTGTSNTYHGMTVVGDGTNPATLVAGAAGVLSINSVVDVENNSTLDLHGFAQGIAALNGTGTGNVTTNTAAATLTIGVTPSAGTTALTGTLSSSATLKDGTGGKLSLVKTGAYTQILAGNNTYSGTTTVSMGTLANGFSSGLNSGFSPSSDYIVTTPGVLALNGFNASIGSLSDGGGTGGSVVNGSSTVTGSAPSANVTLTTGTDGNSTTFSGIISNGTAGTGTLALTKTGIGTFLITGANTYSGGTNINNGVLAFATGSLGTGAVTFTGNSTLRWDNTNGANVTDPTSFTGGLTINSGVTATFDTNGNTVNFANSLLTPGTGNAVTKIGTGMLTLNGNNTYNGATIVTGGTLQAGTATGFSLNSAFTVGPSGTLDVNGLSPTIGSLASPNPGGIVTNNAAATPGTLITGNDGTSTTFAGTIQDGTSTIALTKIGGGTINLATANTYSGGTNLQAGVLVVSNMGALGSGNVNVTGGALQAGGVNMRINVGGNYTQGAGGELDLRIGGTAAGAFDQVAVTGTASLAGRLSVNAVNGYVPKVGDSIPIITSGGARTGTFGQVTGNLLNNPMVKLNVDYFSNKVVLDFVQGSFSTLPSAFVPTPIVAPNGVIIGVEETPIKFIQLTPNEKAVAFALDHVSKNGRSAKLLNFLDSLPITSLPGAFDLIAAPEYGAIYEISRATAKMDATSVENRLDEVHASTIPTSVAGPAGPVDDKGSKEVLPPPQDRLSVFVNGSGEFVTVGDSFNAAGYNFDSGAATLGIDYRFNEHFVAGVLVNYTGTSGDLSEGGRINANSFHGGVYASVFGGGAYVNAFVGGADSNYDITRAGLGSSVHGDTDGADFNALIATGYDFHAGGATFGPVGSFQYTYTGVDSFNESGSLDPLHINSGHGDSFLTNVGLRATYDWHIGSMVLVPEVRATWQHEYGDVFDEISATMLLGSPAFTVTSSPLGRDSLVLNAGFTLQITPLLSAYAFYNGELARTNYQANDVLVGIRYSF